ncbi:Crp/Fnr family transcriptional regulator [Chryseobacterium terrae]|uniref:Crp/Fnr family transcriptional regulator n=1 Tax=Chryseobacterium terrae TaxID=3163299 RepID=A0ABW8Y0S5_9FLAO
MISICIYAEVKKFNSGELIFSERKYSQYYFQIQLEVVKLNNFFEDGKEFVHGFPFEGHCFGEAYLLTEKPYAVNAIAVTDCEIIIMEKQSYKSLVSIYPNLLLSVSRYSAERLHFRYIISSFLGIRNPQVKIQRLLEYLKDYFGYNEPYSFCIPFTRSELASLTGLRVETVIRTLKKMESLEIVKIAQSKIYY